MQILTWGILGTANIAKRSIIPEIINSYNSRLIAIASRTISKAQKLAYNYSCKGCTYEELINNTEINSIYIPLPISMHYEWILKALAAGKNVLVEKSAVSNLSEALEVCTLSEERNLLLMENFQFQFHSQHKFVQDLIDNGKIGELRCFKSSFGFPPFNEENNIRYNTNLGGGSLLDAGAYTLKACSFISGKKLTVRASNLVYHSKYNIDWYGSGMIESVDGEFTGLVSFGFDNFYQCNYELWGSEGLITVTRAFTAKPTLEPLIIIQTKSKGVERIELPVDNHFKNMINYFEGIVLGSDKELKNEERNKILKQTSLIEQFRNLNQRKKEVC